MEEITKRGHSWHYKRDQMAFHHNFHRKNNLLKRQTILNNNPSNKPKIAWTTTSLVQTSRSTLNSKHYSSNFCKQISQEQTHRILATKKAQLNLRKRRHNPLTQCWPQQIKVNSYTQSTKTMLFSIMIGRICLFLNMNTNHCLKKRSDWLLIAHKHKSIRKLVIFGCERIIILRGAIINRYKIQELRSKHLNLWSRRDVANLKWVSTMRNSSQMHQPW